MKQFLFLCTSLFLVQVSAVEKKAPLDHHKTKVGAHMLGSLPSIITAEMLTKKLVRFAEITTAGEEVYFVEGRPEDKGRRVIVCAKTNKDILQGPYSAKNSVHEYGGDALCGNRDALYFTNGKDSQIYKIENEKVSPVTTNNNIRYAEPRVTKSHIFAIFEDHTDKENVINGIVSICKKSHKTIMRESCHDFYAGIAINANEDAISFFSWDHPNMSWDSTLVWKADLIDGKMENLAKVSPEGNISSCDPTFSPNGDLYYISDVSGFWNIYKEDGSAVLKKEADFTKPHWHLGNCLYTFVTDDTIATVYTQNAIDHLGIIKDGQLEEIDLKFTTYSDMKSNNSMLYFIAAGKETQRGVYSYDLETKKLTLIKSAQEETIDSSWISVPEEIAFPTRHGETSYGFYYPPKNPNFDISSPAPLLLISHGGPTGHNPPVFSLGIQYWTSRGFGVLDVNYSGSTGFGRDYRNRLYNNWGVKDVDDCEDAALFLVEKGLADKDRLVVRGGSAGGYTTLALLTFRDTFCAGASYFGVSDLHLLTRDTHKFESRYLDKLIAPADTGKALYDERSPIFHTDKLKKPILLLQGDQDKVVPVNQAEKMYQALLEKNIPCAYILFKGEGHGFVKKENLIKSIESELYFYQMIFGQETTFSTPPLVIKNI